MLYVIIAIMVLVTLFSGYSVLNTYLISRNSKLEETEAWKEVLRLLDENSKLNFIIHSDDKLMHHLTLTHENERLVRANKELEEEKKLWDWIKENNPDLLCEKCTKTISICNCNCIEGLLEYAKQEIEKQTAEVDKAYDDIIGYLEKAGKQ